MNQRKTKKIRVPILPVGPPPSSPLSLHLLIIRVAMHAKAQQMNTTTLNPRLPAGT